MTAGRALDTRIAKEIMELAGVGYYKRQSCRTSEWVCCESGEFTEDEPQWKAALYFLRRPGDINSLFSVPCYSTSMERAWEIVAKLTDSTCYFMMDYHEPNGEPEWCVSFDPLKFPVAEGVANTAPLAICRAAIKLYKTMGKI